MEAEQNIVEQNSDVGVVENTQAPEGVSEEAPSSGQEAKGEHDSADEIQSEETREEKPLSKKAENRFQKLANENKRFRAELQQLKTQVGQAKDALELQQWIAADPQRIKTLLDLANGNKTTEPASDPYADYAPEVAERFRKLDKLEAIIAIQERERQGAQQKSIQENKAHLENVFAKSLQEKGIIKKNGPNDWSYDEKEVGVLHMATLGRLMEIAQDSNRPTEFELHQALEDVFSGMDLIEKRALKKTIRQPGIPPTGSKMGVPPPRGGKETDAQRIARIAAEL